MSSEHFDVLCLDIVVDGYFVLCDKRQVVCNEIIFHFQGCLDLVS